MNHVINIHYWGHEDLQKGIELFELALKYPHPRCMGTLNIIFNSSSGRVFLADEEGQYFIEQGGQIKLYYELDTGINGTAFDLGACVSLTDFDTLLRAKRYLIYPEEWATFMEALDVPDELDLISWYRLAGELGFKTDDELDNFITKINSILFQ